MLTCQFKLDSSLTQENKGKDIYSTNIIIKYIKDESIMKGKASREGKPNAITMNHIPTQKKGFKRGGGEIYCSVAEEEITTIKYIYTLD